MTRTFIIACVVFVALPTLAAAQNDPVGLFGATRPAPSTRSVLFLQTSISEALDSDVSPEIRSRLPGGTLPIGRRSNIIAPDIDYAHEGGTVRPFASMSGLFRYSYAIDEMQSGPARGNAGLEVRMSRAGTVSVSQRLAYSPSYLYELLPVESQSETEPPPSSSPEYQIDRTESFAHRTSVGLVTGSGLGLSVATTADYGRVDFRRTESAPLDRITYGASSRLSYRPKRTHGFSAGYRYRAAEFGSSSTSSGHELPLGFEYTPALSRSRRLDVRVEVAPTMIDMAPAAIEDSPDTQERRKFPVQGDVSVEYPFHLKWRFAAGVRRSVEYLSVLSEPAVTDGARIRLSGVMGRRVDVSVQARYAVAASVLAGGLEDRLTTANGEARVRFALSRWFAMFSEYVYYFYDFGDQRPLGSDLRGTHRQHSVRGGVMLFAQPLGR